MSCVPVRQSGGTYGNEDDFLLACVDTRTIAGVIRDPFIFLTGFVLDVVRHTARRKWRCRSRPQSGIVRHRTEVPWHGRSGTPPRLQYVFMYRVAICTRGGGFSQKKLGSPSTMTASPARSPFARKYRIMPLPPSQGLCRMRHGRTGPLLARHEVQVISSLPPLVEKGQLPPLRSSRQSPFLYFSTFPFHQPKHFLTQSIPQPVA